MFGKSKEEWFRISWNSETIPSHDSFGDVSSTGPGRLPGMLYGIQAVENLLPGEVVAIDGKTMRRFSTVTPGSKAIHLVIWASANTLTSGDLRKVHRLSHAAIPRLLTTVGTVGVHRNHRCWDVRRIAQAGFWTGRLTTCCPPTTSAVRGHARTCSRGLRRQALTVCRTLCQPRSTSRIELPECRVIIDPVYLAASHAPQSGPG